MCNDSKLMVFNYINIFYVSLVKEVNVFKIWLKIILFGDFFVEKSKIYDDLCDKKECNNWYFI